MGRPHRGYEPCRKDIAFEPRQIEMLEALRATASLGKPSMTSLILQAVNEFIAREVAKPGVRVAVEQHLKEYRRVVNLHEVKKDSTP